MIKTKEENNKENNAVEQYSREEILDKIKEYLNENSEYLDKSYFMGNRIDEINTLLEIYGPEKMEQILKKLELDWFFKTYRKRIELKDYYLNNYSDIPFDYDKYHHMIKEVNEIFERQCRKEKVFNIEESFNLAYIGWKFKEYPEKIEITLSEDYEEGQMFKEVVNLLKKMGIYYLMNNINWITFEEIITDYEYGRKLTGDDICYIIRNVFYREFDNDFGFKDN
jgi:hypothetical protein